MDRRLLKLTQNGVEVYVNQVVEVLVVLAGDRIAGAVRVGERI
jgi:hypothetical protein